MECKHCKADNLDDALFCCICGIEFGAVGLNSKGEVIDKDILMKIQQGLEVIGLAYEEELKWKKKHTL